MPAAELAGELLELEDVAPGLADLPERLARRGRRRGWRVVARALTRALARNGEAAPRAEVGRALAGLTRGERVGEVADEVGYSRGGSARWCGRSAGWRRRSTQRVARFEASRAAAGPTGRSPRWPPACGYADQAHLAREWAELAGCPPSTWLREEFPFLQDHEVPGTAG